MSVIRRLARKVVPDNTAPLAGRLDALEARLDELRREQADHQADVRRTVDDLAARINALTERLDHPS